MQNPFLAAIFDLDGVLTDTALVHEAAWREAFAPVPFTYADYRKYIDGRTRVDGIRNFLGAHGLDVSEAGASRIGDKKQKIFYETIERDGVKLKAENVALLALYRASGMKIAVASSSTNARLTLELAGLWPLLDVLVDGNDVKRLGLASKPAADIFQEAARRLGVAFDACLIYEDSPQAVVGALNAGAKQAVHVKRVEATNG